MFRNARSARLHARRRSVRQRLRANLTASVRTTPRRNALLRSRDTIESSQASGSAAVKRRRQAKKTQELRDKKGKQVEKIDKADNDALIPEDNFRESMISNQLRVQPSLAEEDEETKLRSVWNQLGFTATYKRRPVRHYHIGITEDFLNGFLTPNEKADAYSKRKFPSKIIDLSNLKGTELNALLRQNEFRFKTIDSLRAGAVFLRANELEQQEFVFRSDKIWCYSTSADVRLLEEVTLADLERPTNIVGKKSVQKAYAKAKDEEYDCDEENPEVDVNDEDVEDDFNEMEQLQLYKDGRFDIERDAMIKEATLLDVEEDADVDETTAEPTTPVVTKSSRKVGGRFEGLTYQPDKRCQLINDESTAVACHLLSEHTRIHQELSAALRQKHMLDPSPVEQTATDEPKPLKIYVANFGDLPYKPVILKAPYWYRANRLKKMLVQSCTATFLQLIFTKEDGTGLFVDKALGLDMQNSPTLVAMLNCGKTPGQIFPRLPLLCFPYPLQRTRQSADRRKESSRRTFDQEDLDKQKAADEEAKAAARLDEQSCAQLLSPQQILEQVLKGKTAETETEQDAQKAYELTQVEPKNWYVYEAADKHFEKPAGEYERIRSTEVTDGIAEAGFDVARDLGLLPLPTEKTVDENRRPKYSFWAQFRAVFSCEALATDTGSAEAASRGGMQVLAKGIVVYNPILQRAHLRLRSSNIKLKWPKRDDIMEGIHVHVGLDRPDPNYEVTLSRQLYGILRFRATLGKDCNERDDSRKMLQDLVDAVKPGMSELQEDVMRFCYGVNITSPETLSHGHGPNRVDQYLISISPLAPAKHQLSLDLTADAAAELALKEKETNPWQLSHATRLALRLGTTRASGWLHSLNWEPRWPFVQRIRTKDVVDPASAVNVMTEQKTKIYSGCVVAVSDAWLGLEENQCVITDENGQPWARGPLVVWKYPVIDPLDFQLWTAMTTELPSTLPANAFICTRKGPGILGIGGGDYDGDRLTYTTHKGLVEFLRQTEERTKACFDDSKIYDDMEQKVRTLTEKFRRADESTQRYVGDFTEKENTDKLKAAKLLRFCRGISTSGLRGRLTNQFTRIAEFYWILTSKAERKTASDDDLTKVLNGVTSLVVTASFAYDSPKKWHPSAVAKAANSAIATAREKFKDQDIWKKTERAHYKLKNLMQENFPELPKRREIKKIPQVVDIEQQMRRYESTRNAGRVWWPRHYQALVLDRTCGQAMRMHVLNSSWYIVGLQSKELTVSRTLDPLEDLAMLLADRLKRTKMYESQKKFQNRLRIGLIEQSEFIAALLQHEHPMPLTWNTLWTSYMP